MTGWVPLRIREVKYRFLKQDREVDEGGDTERWMKEETERWMKEETQRGG